MTAILHSLEELDLVAFLERHVSLLPVHLATLHRTALALFAHEVRGPHFDDGDLEQFLDSDLDRILGRLRADPKQDLAGLLAGQRSLLGDDRREYQALGVHFFAPAKRASRAF